MVYSTVNYINIIEGGEGKPAVSFFLCPLCHCSLQIDSEQVVTRPCEINHQCSREVGVRSCRHIPVVSKKACLPMLQHCTKAKRPCPSSISSLHSSIHSW